MKRLPIIRHIRWAWHLWQVDKHYASWAKLGMLPVNRARDEDVLLKIWRGEA